MPTATNNKIEKLSPRPGDVLVVTAPGDRQDVQERVRRELEGRVPPGVLVLVIAPGATIDVCERERLGEAVDAWRRETETPEEREKRMRTLPGGFDYDPRTDTLTILGIRYSGELFRKFAFRRRGYGGRDHGAQGRRRGRAGCPEG